MEKPFKPRAPFDYKVLRLTTTDLEAGIPDAKTQVVKFLDFRCDH